MGCGTSKPSSPRSTASIPTQWQDPYISLTSQNLWLVRTSNSAISHWEILLMPDHATAKGHMYGLWKNNGPGSKNSSRISCNSTSTGVQTKTTTTDLFVSETEVDRARMDRGAWHYFRVPGAVSTRSRLSKACGLVREQHRFNALTENCQVFVIEVLRVLNQWDAAMVPLGAIEQVRKKGMVSVRRATVVPGRASLNVPAWGWFTSEMSQGSSRGWGSGRGRASDRSSMPGAWIE